MANLPGTLTQAILFEEPSALAGIDLAFKRAVLARLDDIENQGEFAATLKAIAVQAMLAEPRPEPWIAERHAPSALLVPERSVVRFAGRSALEAELIGWCEAPPDVGVQLLHGHGGMGKTRFAQELCRTLARRGWRAGLLQRRLAEVPGWLAPHLGAVPEPLLIVIDYAEDKPDDVDRAFACARARQIGLKVRILLLARGAGEWWRTLPDSAPSVLDLWGGPAIREPRPIGALAVGAADRVWEYERARQAFSKLLPAVERAGEPPDLSVDDFAPVLMLHMAALAAAEGQDIASADQLFDWFLSREAPELDARREGT